MNVKAFPYIDHVPSQLTSKRGDKSRPGPQLGTLLSLMASPLLFSSHSATGSWIDQELFRDHGVTDLQADAMPSGAQSLDETGDLSSLLLLAVVLLPGF